MKLGRTAILLVFMTQAGQAQLLPSQAAGAAHAQVVMLNINGTVAAGILAGFDADKVYIATAAHVTKLMSKPLPDVDVRFEDAPDLSRNGVFFNEFESPDNGDLAVIIVKKDDRLRVFLDGLDFAMLSPVPLPPSDTPVTSIGYSGGEMWKRGMKESLSPVDRGYLRLTSDVSEGQSGGAVYNEAWELIGMAVDRGDGVIFARPIESIIEQERRNRSKGIWVDHAPRNIVKARFSGRINDVSKTPLIHLSIAISIDEVQGTYATP